MSAPRFEIDGYVAVLPAPEFAGAVVEYYKRNDHRLRPISPTRPEGFLAEPFWRERLRKAREEFQAGESMRLFVLSGEQVAGHISYASFVRGPLQQCFLGYAVDEAHEGRGLLTRLLPLTNAYVFRHLGIHRISANYMPTNERSARLLRRLGFAVEGYARDYLLLDGHWRDHVLTALINRDWKRVPGSP